MNKQQLYIEVGKLVNAIDLGDRTDEILNNALHSGVFQLAAEQPNSYRLPRSIVYAALVELAEQFKPAHPLNLMEAELLQQYA